jgi:hypothetical protein
LSPSSSKWLLPILAVVLITSGSLHSPAAANGADVQASAKQRFSQRGYQEVPDFRRHVLPLLGRLGCNGRSCHGSFQGQGGFRLSLFGYDALADYRALCRSRPPRVDLEHPERSLILIKPSEFVVHGGGEVFPLGGWEHRLLYRWIAAGVPGRDPEGESLLRLEPRPGTIRFNAQGETLALRIVAHWSNGDSEDVTPLCRFRTNDDTVATVDADGLVTSAGKGLTHLIAFYDDDIAHCEVLLPVSPEHGQSAPPLAATTEIDRLVNAQLRDLGIVPAQLCSDEEFLRRMSLDLTGTLPTPEEMDHFVSDRAVDKRTAKVSQLLNSNAYSAWWATRFGDWLGTTARDFKGSYTNEMAAQQNAWLRRRMAENEPYDKLVGSIVTASSRARGQRYEEFVSQWSAYFLPLDHALYDDFSQRPDLPHYWMQRELDDPEEFAIEFCHTFLGLRLQCAQCHKHPFDVWTQEDFRSFAAFFDRVRYGTPPAEVPLYQGHLEITGLKDVRGAEYRKRADKMLSDGEAIPWQEMYIEPYALYRARAQSKSRDKSKAAQSTAVVSPRVLGSERRPGFTSEDPRPALLEWMLDEENPYFVRAIVNRVWAHYFGVGIIDPPDDLNLANPPVNGPLLDYLVEQFVAQGYDLQWLHREILTSAAYQRACRGAKPGDVARRHFAQALVRRLPAEVVVDAIAQATASRARSAELAHSVEQRAIADPHGLKPHPDRAALEIFGRPSRGLPCDCDRKQLPTLAQTLYLQNDPEVAKQIAAEGGLRDEMAQLWKSLAGMSPATRSDASNSSKQETAAPETAPAENTRADVIDILYLQCLGRRPNDQERRLALRYVQQAPDVSEALYDVIWALLNTKEFVTNH